MNKSIKKIAIVRLSALGDIVNSAIVLQFIYQKYPDAIVEWITEEVFEPLFLYHPHAKIIHTLNIKKIKKTKSVPLLMQTFSRLKNLGDYDIIIDMQGLIKSAIVARLIGKNTHGFDKNSTRESLATLFYNTTSHIGYEQNVIKRNCRVVSDALGFEITDEMILHKQNIFPSIAFGFKDYSKKNIIIVIGASWESKRYPKEQVAKLCNLLQQNCHILWGSEKELEDAQWICKHSDYASLAPKLALNELVYFITSSDLVIGNDTGPTHLAWAQNIPSITLLGPTTTRMIYETPKNIGIKSSSKVDIFNIDKNDFSIQDINVELIANKAKELLNNGI